MKKIFGHTFIALVDKLINAVDKKEEKQIIINDIKNNSDKIIEQKYSQFVIQQAHKRGDLKDAVKIILEINELLTLDKVSNDWLIRYKKYLKAFFKALCEYKVYINLFFLCVSYIQRG